MVLKHASNIAEHDGFKAPLVGGLPRQIHPTIHPPFGHFNQKSSSLTLLIPDTAVLRQCYDFTAATEVAEHLFQPGETLATLLSLLPPGGWLGLMTKMVIDQAAFSNWRYKQDPTHVCFFSRETFSWWASQAGCEVTFAGNDVILLRKP